MFVFQDRVSLSNRGWPETQVSFKFTEIHCLYLPSAGIKVCATTAWLNIMYFKHKVQGKSFSNSQRKRESIFMSIFSMPLLLVAKEETRTFEFYSHEPKLQSCQFIVMWPSAKLANVSQVLFHQQKNVFVSLFMHVQ